MLSSPSQGSQEPRGHQAQQSPISKTSWLVVQERLSAEGRTSPWHRGHLVVGCSEKTCSCLICHKHWEASRSIREFRSAPPVQWHPGLCLCNAQVVRPRSNLLPDVLLDLVSCILGAAGRTSVAELWHLPLHHEHTAYHQEATEEGCWFPAVSQERKWMVSRWASCATH